MTNAFTAADQTQDFYGGKALKDDSMTIVHHYNFHRDLDFPYSHISSGFLLSRPLLSKLASKIKEKKLPMAFSLDAYYEVLLGLERALMSVVVNKLLLNASVEDVVRFRGCLNKC